MNLHDDEALKQEVIYLHSLWHQGPPSRNHIPSPNFNPINDPTSRSRPNYIPPADLRLLSLHGTLRPQVASRNPSFPQNFSKNKRARPDSGREWPVNEVIPSPRTASGWPEFNRSKKPRPIPAEEKAKFAVNKLQKDIHRTCREFFATNSGEDDSSVGGGDESDTEVDQGLEKVGSSKEFQFLSKLFEENGKLKEYYEKNTGNGEFWCLVCGGIGDKSCRKFKSCLALVQHSLAIHKTNMTNQHRAFAQVVCNVLGWDVNNPVASSQKDPQGADVAVVAESAPEQPSEPMQPEEKKVMPADVSPKTAALQLQQNASEALKDLFAKYAAGSAKETEVNGDENLSKEMEFISQVFSENLELKSYYEKHCESGHFICLICATTDKKITKRFKRCYGLIQHSTKVINMKKKAHTAYARSICKLLSWDINRLPRRVAKAVAPRVKSEPNPNEDKPSSVTEEHMCEDKADKPEANTEASLS